MTFMLLATALPAIAQDDQVPLLLRQQLDVALQGVLANGDHHVRVVCDTADYIIVTTKTNVAGVAEAALPEGQLNLSSDGRRLTIPFEYPYRNIDIHTSANKLSLTANAGATVRLENHVATPVQLKFLHLTASVEGSRVEAMPTIETDEAMLTATNSGTVYCADLQAKHLEKVAPGGRIIMKNGEETIEYKGYSTEPAQEKGQTEKVKKEGSGVVRLMLNHDLPMFVSFSVGATGWSGSPFGGMTSEMGIKGHRFIMGVNPTGYVAFQYGVNLLTRRHWTLGVGLGIKEEHFAAENARIDIVGNYLLNADLSPYYSSAQFLQHYQPGDIVWRSSMDINYFYLPLRAEWRLRSSYRGLRISAQLMPGVALWRSKTTLVRQGNYPDGLGSATPNRIDVETTNVGRYVNPFRCDLRLDVGISNFSLFIETALTPLFRHQSYFLTTIFPTDQDAINAAVYPMTIGCSINL